MTYLIEYEGRSGPKPKYPLRALKVGESVFYPVPSRLLSKATCKHKPMQFRVRKVMKDGVEGCRVWRIA